MPDEVLQQVDENDTPIGGMTRNEVETTGKRYRVVRVIVEDEAGHTLIQKRVSTKNPHPNCWDTAAAGHVDLGESYEIAAGRELSEEIGLKNVPLEEVCYYYLETPTTTENTVNRFTKTYKTIVPHETTFLLQASEVSEVKWVTVEELKQLVTKQGEVTNGLIQTYERYYNSKQR